MKGKGRLSVRTTTQISSLEDELVKIMDRRVSKSVGKVVKVAQVNPRHEDINMIRPLMLGKIITVQRST
jgi:hypothetical protein